LTGMSAIGR